MMLNPEFASPWPIIRGAAEAFRPPKRITVADGAQQSLMIRAPGGYAGPWSPEETPYMVEPMNMLASRRHEAVCFVGPAQSGKTASILDGWFSYAVTCDPGDMLIVQMSQEKAREFSKTRIDRAIRNSPALRDLLSQRANDDNTHDKLFRHGMWLKIGWPSASQLSSTPYRYVALTDYDRYPDNIDGEGAAYGLALKRTTTFLSRGMCAVESSPGREVEDPHWRPVTAHEAPPCSGVLGIYNRSDRRRWYWQCPDCSEFFEAAPGLKLFSLLPPEAELLETVRTENLQSLADKCAKVVCPHCGSIIEQRWKGHLNDRSRAVWLADGQTINSHREITGEAQASSIAGYWLGGVAATYQPWRSLVLRYLQGIREYALSGSEEALKNTVNTDQGMPYLPRHLAEETAGNRPEDRAEDLPRYIVPPEARFLITSADVQGGSAGRFIVEVRAFGPHLESWLVDRYAITTTEREGVAAQVDPAGYAEDWDLLTEKAVKATYRTADGREMRVKLVAVDTGGEAGTTANAYAWYRRIRKAGLAGRVILVKGASQRQETPVSKGTGRNAKGQPMRDMPVYLVATDYYKDVVAASLRRKAPGPGYAHFPDWLPASYYSELQAEVRDAKGKWKKIRARNEALDLWVYALAACEYLGFGSKGRLSWDSPPGWALPQTDANAEIITPEERRAERKQPARPAPVQRIASDDWSSRL